MITDYRIIRGTLAEVEQQVTLAIARSIGWEPSGSLILDEDKSNGKTLYVQAMSRNDTPR